LGDSDSYRFDYESDGVVADVKMRLRALAPLRSAVMHMAAYLGKHPEAHGFLLLIDPRVSDARLQQEWEMLELTVQRTITRRIALVRERNGDYRGWPPGREEVLHAQLETVHQSVPGERRTRLRRPDYYSVILQILIQQWLTGAPAEPLTAKLLGDLAGCSYPTVAAALERLRHVLRESAGRGIELDRFPAEEWQAFILNADRIRGTKRYRDRSGKPRHPAALMDRLQSVSRLDVAVGGVIAALDHAPDLDLVGTPRLDLCVHAPENHVDLSFIETLDPALEETRDRELPAYLAVHFVRSRESFFSGSIGGLPRAGVLECLLDLYELRLVPQANDWMAALRAQRNAGS
jgi:hypothetical protein